MLETESDKALYEEIVFLDKIERLKKDFSPKYIKVFNSGNAFYHYSKHPHQLVRENKFDPNRSQFRGIMHFTEVPTHQKVRYTMNIPQDWSSNIVATTRRPSVLFSSMDPLNDNFSNYSKQRNLIRDAGFDGEIGVTTSTYVSQGSCEIIFYPEALYIFNGNVRLFSAKVPLTQNP